MVGIFCANGLEQCEALIVYDLLFRAGIDVKLVSIYDVTKIKSSHNVCFETDMVIDEVNVEDLEMLILPGGMPGTLNLEACDKLKSLILKQHSLGKYLAAICAAPSIFIKLKLLGDFEFTCYKGFENGLKGCNDNVVFTQNIITSKALGTSFEFALRIIELLKGKETAFKVKDAICFNDTI